MTGITSARLVLLRHISSLLEPGPDQEGAQLVSTATGPAATPVIGRVL